MTLATPTEAKSTPRQRENVEFLGKGFGGMKTVPNFGKGCQRIDNMQLSSNFLEGIYGASITKATGETQMYKLGTFQKADQTYQKMYVIKSGSTWKVRALEEDGTIVTPTGGAGDVTFTTSSIRFVQNGLTGYVLSADTAKVIHSWTGAALTNVTIAGSADPNKVDSAWVTDKRVCCVDKSQGLAMFSQIATTLTAWSVGGSGASVGGTFDSMPRIATCGIAAGGYSIVFTEQEGKANKVTPISDGSDIYVTTGVEGWNCEVGFDDEDRITASDNFVYGARAQGFYQIDPVTGRNKNLIENSGAAERYWSTFDFSSAKVIWHPQEKVVIVFCKSSGDAGNDKAVVYSEEYGAFYLLTNVFVLDAVVADQDMFAIEETGGSIFKLYDTTAARAYTDTTDMRKRLVTEWDSFGSLHTKKRLKRVSVYATVFPDDVMTVRAYKDGDFSTPVSEDTFTGVDVTDTGGGIANIGEYILAVGSPDISNASDKLERTKTTSKGTKFCVEVEVTSNNPFQVHSIVMEYKARGQLIHSSNIGNVLP